MAQRWPYLCTMQERIQLMGSSGGSHQGTCKVQKPRGCRPHRKHAGTLHRMSQS